MTRTKAKSKQKAKTARTNKARKGSKRFISVPILEKALDRLTIEGGIKYGPGSKSLRSGLNRSYTQNSQVMGANVVNPYSHTTKAVREVVSGRFNIGFFNSPMSNPQNFTALVRSGINPTISGLFGAKLYSQSTPFDRYYFRKIRFIWEPACSTNINGNLGMAWQRNPNDPAAGNMTSLMDYENSMTFPPYLPAVLELGKNELARQDDYFIWPNPSVPEDNRNTFVGTFNLFSDKFKITDTGLPLGQLFVEYEVILHYQASPAIGLAKLLKGDSCPCCKEILVYDTLINKVIPQKTYKDLKINPLIWETYREYLQQEKDKGKEVPAYLKRCMITEKSSQLS